MEAYLKSTFENTFARPTPFASYCSAVRGYTGGNEVASILFQSQSQGPHIFLEVIIYITQIWTQTCTIQKLNLPAITVFLTSLIWYWTSCNNIKYLKQDSDIFLNVERKFLAIKLITFTEEDSCSFLLYRRSGIWKLVKVSGFWYKQPTGATYHANSFREKPHTYSQT